MIIAFGVLVCFKFISRVNGVHGSYKNRYNYKENQNGKFPFGSINEH